MTRALIVLAALGAALSACDDGTPIKRGFGSRQLLQLRDPTFEFAGARGDLVLYWTGAEPATTRYWSIDVTTGELREHDAMFSDVPAPQYRYPVDPNARFHCRYLSSNTGWWLEIDDAETGQLTTIDGMPALGDCPSEANPNIRMWRPDENGYLSLWAGPYDALQMVPIDLAIVRVAQTFRSADMTVNVLAGRPAAPEAIGLYAVDMVSFAVTELVPPALQGGAWAEGAMADGALDSSSLAVTFDIAAIGSHFRYWRTIAGGGAETMFVGPFASGPSRELALFRRDNDGPRAVPVGPANGKFPPDTPVPPVWLRSSATGSHDLLIWDDGMQRLVTCPSPFRPYSSSPIGMASADGSRIALFVAPSPDAPPDASPRTDALLLVDLMNPGAGSTPCNMLAPAYASTAGFSPDGSALFWLLHPPDQAAVDAELWLAATDGSGPRLVGTDEIQGPPNAPRFVGPSQLQLQIGTDLVWLDTHDDSFLTHAIAGHVRGTAIDRGRWLITGYDASDQDATARLGVIDRDTGVPRLISPEVASFMSPDIYDLTGLGVAPAPRNPDDPIRVVYLVRGRNASSQDGLWVATINASDIP
jgi:hypothetical protein